MRKLNYFLLVFIPIFLISLGVWAQDENNDTDTTAPAAISDLTVSTTTESSINLTWTAPGDDNTTGTATSYDLRYDIVTITEEIWASSTTQVENEPTPQPASSTETMVVEELSSSTTYYFAIKTKDEADNESDLSNIVSGTTLGEEEPSPPAELTIEMTFTPRTLNLASQGQWITVHLFFPANHKARDVDISTVKLNDTLSPNSDFKGVNQFKKGKKDKGNNSSNLVLKFPRSDFVDLAGETPGTFEITVSGVVNEETFSASDSINILNVAPEEEDSLVGATGTPEVYTIKNGKKRHIPSSRAFERRGLAWGNIKKISQEELESYPEDELIGASDSPAVYLIIAGMKRHIPSSEVFESYGFDWDDISIVSRDELGDYSDVNLVRAAGDVKVYLLAGGKKHWIPTIAVFNKHGYKWENVIIVNSTEQNAVPEGENIE